MNDELRELFANLPAYLGGHILLSVTALASVVVVALPLGIVATRRPQLGECVLAIAGAIQTIPTLALLALLMVLLGGLIGFWPAFLALVLYGVLPVLSNTVVGIRGIDPGLIEAARGLGMNDRQSLWQVELPLAMPVIIGGIRTATVLIVGTATLATPIGGLSLGNYIFAGIATLNHTSTVFGCIVAALLAISLDQLVRLLEVAARRRSRAVVLGATAGLLLVTSAALYEPVNRRFGGNRVVIASAAFNEQYTLSHAMATEFEAAGFQPERREGMAHGIQHLALQRDEADCLVTYTGDVWTLLMKRHDYADRETTYREVKRFIEEEFGAVCLGRLGFENAYTVAVAPGRAAEWKLKSIHDLAMHTRTKLSRPLRVGADTGFFHQKEWRRLKDKYGLRDTDVEAVAMDPTLMYSAVSEGQVDAIIAFGSDGRVETFGLQLLDDPERVFPPYDAILLASRSAAARPGFVEALQPLLGAVDQNTMREANRRVDVEKQSPRQVAGWLLKAIAASNHP